MKQYIKGGQIKTAKQIVIKNNGKQTINPTEEMVLADGWEVYTPPTYEPTIEDVRKRKRDEIIRYDSSKEVNEFTINDISVWLDKATRSGLMLRFQAEEAIGRENTTLWYDGHQFDLMINTAITMLYAIEIYASACYDNTQKHLTSINNLLSIEEIENYDYKTGYPEKLKF